MEITTEYDRGAWVDDWGTTWTTYPEIILRLKTWSDRQYMYVIKKPRTDLTILIRSTIIWNGPGAMKLNLSQNIGAIFYGDLLRGLANLKTQIFINWKASQRA